MKADVPVGLTTKVCPLSDIEYRGGCPNRTCVYNDVGACLHTRLASIAAENFDQRVRILTRAKGVNVDAQMQRLHYLAKNFEDQRGNERRIASCPNCGYIRPCSSTALCDERREAVEGVGMRDLMPHEVWHAVLSGADSFIGKDKAAKLIELASSKDLRRTN